MSATVELPQRPAESWEAPPASSRAARTSWRIGGVALALLPAAMIGYLAFRTGGYYAEAFSGVVVVLAVALGGAAIASKRPFAGLSAPLLVACGALFLLVVWTWFSAGWSDAPIRALTESQRTALYFLTLLFFGAFLRRQGSLSLATTALGIVMGGVCAAALATRLYPDVFTVSSGLAPQRLNFPLSYWNSLGLFAGIALILLANMASDLRVRAPLRMLGAAGVPIAALTIYFTFSRGATGAIALGLVAYLVVGRSRGMIAAALSAGPATALALMEAYDADLLATHEPTTAAAAAQGHDVGTWLLLACIGAAVLRAALIPLDNRLSHMRSPVRLTRGHRIAAVAIAAVLALGAAVALDAPGQARDAYDSLVEPDHTNTSDARTRFNQVTLSGREDHWNVALDYYRAHRLRGEGAGTFETQWLRSRPLYAETSEAHSLYIEVLSELGIVGFTLILTALGTILLGLLVRARGPRRPIYGALFAATLMWAVHAGVDWDWELPAVGLGLFALAGLALARPVSSSGMPARVVTSLPFRIAVAFACLLVALTGARTVIADAAIDDAKAALSAGECGKASRDARLARSAVSTHPAAYEVLAYCDLEAGRSAAAIHEMRRATELDPNHWRYWYGLGVASGTAGQDPRPAMRRAWVLNPLGALVRANSPGERLREAPRRQWKRLATRAPLPSN